MRARVLFLTWLAVMATPGRFLSLFYQAHGLTPSQIGILLSLSFLASTLASPILGVLADRSKSRTRFLYLIQSLSLLAFLAQCMALPDMHVIYNHRFAYIIVMALGYRFFGGPVEPIVIGIAIAQLRRLHGADGYVHFGHERLWGAVSWAIMSLVLGVLLDMPHVGMQMMYVMFVIVTVGFFYSLFCFEKDDCGSPGGVESGHAQYSAIDGVGEDGHVDTVEEMNMSSVLLVVKGIVCNGGLDSMLLFNLVFWLGAGTLIVESLMFLYFVNELHASNSVCGLTVVVTVLFEIPLFAQAPNLLRRYGASTLLVIGSIAYVIRVVGYAAAGNTWVIVLLEPLHGVTFACTHVASVAYVSERGPGGLEATAQTVVSVVSGVGSMVGLGLGGIIMQEAGSRLLCRACAVAVGVAAGMFVAANGTRTTSTTAHGRLEMEVR